MTTNVLDGRNRRVSSDSRWSIQLPNELVFVDNTGFDKIAERTRAVMICAGDAKLIDQWKVWFVQPTPSNEVPPTDRAELDGSFHEIYVTIIVKPTYEVLFSSGDYIKYLEDAAFAGSGRGFARDCYAVNGCSIKCVETASSHDPKTGGETKYVDFTSGTSNLHQQIVTFQELEASFLQKGMVMNMATKEIRSINGTGSSELAEAITKEKVNISAPTGHPPRTWTLQEKLDVSSAMRRVVELEQSGQ